MTTPTATRLIDRIGDVAPVIKAHATEAEEQRNLSTAAFEAMADAGLFQMFVPRALGGLEADIIDAFETIEAISRIDSAAGWTLEILSVGGGTIGALLPPEGAEEVFSNPKAVVAGGFNPPGTAVPVDGGFRLSGRWGFASGCLHANWFVDPALIIKDGQPEIGPHGEPVLLALLYPAGEGQVVDTWHTLGMRGTGSHDIVADNVFVPAQRTGPMRPFEDLPPAYQGPIYKLGLLPTILGNAVVSLGIARAAIDEATDLTKSRISAFMQPRPVDRGVVQMHLAKAEATLCAARAFFYDALGKAWKSALAGERPDMDQRIHVQLAASHAAEASASAVDHVHQAAGSAGLREDMYTFARHFRDVHTITQHALCSAARYESMGQAMLGLESEWPFFAL